MSFVSHIFHDVGNAIGDVFGAVVPVVKVLAPIALDVAGVAFGQPELIAAGAALSGIEHHESFGRIVESAGLGFVGGELGEAGGLFGSGAASSLNAANFAQVAVGTSGITAGSIIEGSTTSLFSDVVGGIGDFLKGAGSDFGSSASSIIGGIEGMFKNGFGGFLSTLGSISGSLTSEIDKFATLADNVLGPINKVVTDIDNVAEALENKLIIPITSVITQTENSAKSLIDGIHNDLSEGLAGIVNIPSTVANALTSEGATLQRANRELANSTAATAQDILVPGLGKAIGQPLAQIATSLLASLSVPESSLANSPRIDLSGAPAEEQIAALGAKLQGEIKGLPWPIPQLLGLPVAAFEDLWSLVGLLESWKRAGILAGTASDPVEPLPVEAVARAVRRGILPADEAPREAAFSGYDAQRYAVIQALQNKLLDEPLLLEALWRGLLNDDDYARLLALLGYDDGQAALLKATSAFLFPATDAVRLFARGAISQQDMQQVLDARRMSPTDQVALPQLMRELPQPQSAINAFRRQQAAGIGVLQDAFSVPMPPEVSAIYAERMIDERQATYDWINHWDLPSTRDWFLLKQRGAVSQGDYIQALVSKAVPDALQPALDTLFREYMPFWYLKEILATGKVPKETAIGWCTGQGFTQGDAELIVEASIPAVANNNPALAQQLAKVTATTGKDLYEAGTITESTYKEILTALGDGPETIQLNIELSNLTLNSKERAALVDILKVHAVAGVISTQHVATELYNNGFTTVEVNQALATIADDIAKKIKLPSEAQLTAMVKKGVITSELYLQMLQQLGYPLVWAQRILAIE